MKIATFGWTATGALTALFLLLVWGCGGGGGGGTPPATIAVNMSTSAPNNKVAYNASCTITATVENSTDTTALFKISPTTGYASFVAQGNHQYLFTAGTTAETFTITAAADADSAAIGTIKITVVPVTVTISPTAATVPPSGVVQFSGTVTGSTNTAVNFSSPSGTFKAVAGNPAATSYTAPSTPGQYIVTATAAASASATATATVTVSVNGATNATVNGTITDDSSRPVSGVVIQFFDSGGTEIAQATTSSTGAFTASVPVTAISFELSSSSININDYYESFTYGGKIYDPLIAGCNAPLPALASGGSVTLGPIVLPTVANAPPPPPTGC